MKDRGTEPEAVSNLRWKAIQRHLPYIATFELTYRCNLKCSHCYLNPGDPHEEEMPVELWIRTIRELTDLGTFYFTLTGGEPTLYPGFWDILDELHLQETVIRVFTNATTLTEEDVDRLIRCGVRYTDISLHGPDAATHEAVTRTPGSFDETIKAVKKLRAAGVHVNLKGSLLKSNYRAVNELDRYMKSLGGNPIISTTITPANNGGSGPLERAVNAEEFCFIYENYYREDLEPTGAGKERILPVMGCTAGFSTLSIAPDGEVFPCLQLRVSMGSVQRNTLRRIWHHAPLNLHLNGLAYLSPPGCLGCALADSCMRCPGLALIETGSLWKPSPSACQAARNYQTANELHVSRKGTRDEHEELHPAESDK